MADRKNPVFLRVLIVVVALLLGFSLNMFQFRNPFRNMGTDPANGPELSDKNRFPSRQETALPVSPVAKPPQPEVSANGDKAAQPQAVAKDEPKTAPADAPASANAPAPQAVADAEPDKTEKQGAPVSITVEHETPSLGLPKVTSDSAKAKAAKIGRQVATGVADGKTATEAISHSPAAPAPAETGTSSAQTKASNGASADKAVSKAPQATKPDGPTPAETIQTAKSPGDASKPAKVAAADQAAVQTPQASQPAP
ncbi:MAG: hypothetical protein ACLGSA_07400, partial [Acidobacteriota bacterium]